MKIKEEFKALHLYARGVLVFGLLGVIFSNYLILQHYDFNFLHFVSGNLFGLAYVSIVTVLIHYVLSWTDVQLDKLWKKLGIDGREKDTQ